MRIVQCRDKFLVVALSNTGMRVSQLAPRYHAATKNSHAALNVKDSPRKVRIANVRSKSRKTRRSPGKKFLKFGGRVGLGWTHGEFHAALKNSHAATNGSCRICRANMF